MGEERELATCWKEVNQKKVGEFMLQSSADWIQWKRNPPLASHMGGYGKGRFNLPETYYHLS